LAGDRATNSGDQHALTDFGQKLPTSARFVHSGDYN
jgi:hypothetical protein